MTEDELELGQRVDYVTATGYRLSDPTNASGGTTQ